jgi:hypothetical protein
MPLVVVATSVTIPGASVASAAKFRAVPDGIGIWSSSRLVIVRPRDVLDGSTSGASAATTSIDSAGRAIASTTVSTRSSSMASSMSRAAGMKP